MNAIQRDAPRCFRELREANGFTQSELAEKAGTTQATISRLESGDSQRIDFSLIEGLCLALACEPGDLFSRTTLKRRCRCIRRLRKQNIKPGFLYAVSNDSGHFKVGYTRNVEGRLRTLRTGSPVVRLLATTPGGKREERQAHAELKAWRAHREWFAECPESIEAMRRLFDPSNISNPEQLES